MDMELIVEMLKNNRALWVTATVTGLFAIIISILDAIWLFIQRRKQLEYDKQLEKYKTGLENKTYISKTKFDAEFSTYRELSKAFFNMTLCICDMIPYGYYEEAADKEVKKKQDVEKYDKALKATVAAQNALFESAPFIPKDFFDKFDGIRQTANVQLTTFSWRWNVLYIADAEQKEKISIEDRKRSKEMRENLDALNGEIRDYLSKLDVMN